MSNRKKWRQHMKAVQATERKRIEDYGIACERCGLLSMNIRCIHADYWLCPACVCVHQGLADWSARLNDEKRINVTDYHG